MRRSILIALILALLATESRADYKDDYKAGVQAADRRQWSEVARRMERAIAGKATEGEQISIYGMRFEPYLPFYYLGVAQFNLGDCGAARKAWTESERQKAIMRTNFYANLKKLRGSCPDTEPVPPKADPVPTPIPTGPDPALPPAIKSAESEIERAEAAAQALARLRRESDAAEIWNAEATWKTREAQASHKLALARTSLAQNRSEGTLGEIKRAGEGAVAARGDFEAIRKDLIAAQRLLAQWQSARTELKKRAAEAETLLRNPAPATPPVTTATADLRKLIASAGAISRQTPVRQVQSLTDRLAAAINGYQKLLVNVPQPADAPPAILISAASAYFGGDYARAVSLLESARFDHRLAAAQAMLFRGAARYALYLIGGERDAQMRARALQDLREASRLDQRAVPDPRFFSPRLAQFAQTALQSR
jgi:hypothetical protein